MNLELKAIKHSAFASQETHCYEAALYLDGQPLTIVSNQGHGGCDDDYQHPKCKLSNEDYRAKMMEISDYFKSLPPVKTDMIIRGEPFEHQPDLEGWCCDQVNLHLAGKDLKRMLKSKVVMFDRSDGKIYTVKKKYHPDQLDKINAKWPEHDILNAMPFDEALKLFNK